MFGECGILGAIVRLLNAVLEISDFDVVKFSLHRFSKMERKRCRERIWFYAFTTFSYGHATMPPSSTRMLFLSNPAPSSILAAS